MFEVTVNYSILEFCKDVLKRRFPQNPIKQQILEVDSEKLNFACPYCGDSDKDHNKKRGNLFFKTNTYKCFNDGCMKWVPLEKFVSTFSLKYQLEIPSIEKNKPTFTPTESKNKKGFLIEFLINKEIGNKLLKFTDIIARFSLVPCTKAVPGSPIHDFITRRKISELPFFEKTCYFDSREDKIYLFNLDLKSDSILVFAIRHIDSSWNGPKYNIKNYSEFKKNGLVFEQDETFITEVNTLNNYFNILNINFSKDVTVTEGQLDSLFIENCIATTGVTKSKYVLESLLTKQKTRIFFDNDKAGKNATIEFIKKGYRVFLWSPVISELIRRFPEARKEIIKIKDINDLYCFLNARDPQLTFISFNRFIDEYFSNSAFDLILV